MLVKIFLNVTKGTENPQSKLFNARLSTWKKTTNTWRYFALLWHLKPDYHLPTGLLFKAGNSQDYAEDSAQFSKQCFQSEPPTQKTLGLSLPLQSCCTSFLIPVSLVTVAMCGLQAWLVTLDSLDAMSRYTNVWKDYQDMLATPSIKGGFVGLRSGNSSPDLNFSFYLVVCVL